MDDLGLEIETRSRNIDHLPQTLYHYIELHAQRFKVLNFVGFESKLG